MVGAEGEVLPFAAHDNLGARYDHRASSWNLLASYAVARYLHGQSRDTSLLDDFPHGQAG
jgi:hypothetical protein